MKSLLIVTAIGEIATGLVLFLMPSHVIFALLGASLDTPGGLIIGRVCGAGLFALGLACWLARNDRGSRAAIGLVLAMLVYNTAAVLVLGFARFALGLSTVGLWFAMLLHAALAVWCVICLRSERSRSI